MSGAGTPWSKADDARLRLLWAEGHVASAIGRAMRRSKNGVIGRSHRLHLPPRPSPLPNKERVAASAPALPTATPEAPKSPMPQKSPEKPVAALVPLPSPPPMPSVRVCQYPHGHPKERGFRYCEAPVVGAGPYCPTHHALCWTGRARAA